MQFFILLIGVLLFVFYNLYQPPINFNKNLISFQEKNNPELLDNISNKSIDLFSEKKELIVSSGDNFEEIISKDNQLNSLRKKLEDNAFENGFKYEKPESDFIFLHFILNYLPQGIIGIIIALILSAAMSSTSAEINALSAITTIDIYKRFINKRDNPSKDVIMSKLFSLGWGIIAILFSLFFAQKENLIESINIVASLLYGNVLGIFLVAFFIKIIKSNHILFASILSQSLVFILYFYLNESISYLWFNFIGTFLTSFLSYLLYLLDIRK